MDDSEAPPQGPQQRSRLSRGGGATLAHNGALGDSIVLLEHLHNKTAMVRLSRDPW